MHSYVDAVCVLSVSTHLINEHVFQQNKRKRYYKNRVNSIPVGLVENTSMAAVPLFRYTNMAAMTLRENTLHCYVKSNTL